MKVGDIVKMKSGYSAPGIVIRMSNVLSEDHAWVFVTVLWSDEGRGLEKSMHLDVINEEG